MRVLVCDDRNPDDIMSAAVAGLEAAGLAHDEVVALSPKNLDLAVRQLFDGVRAYLDDGKEMPGETAFDGYDLLLLDHGLTALTSVGVRLTADQLVGYLHAFSRTDYVVSLNRLSTDHGHVDFDLKFLMGDADAHADQALVTQHLENSGLWSGKPTEGSFCPWYWPNLSRAPHRRREQVKIVEENFDQPILEVLGFPLEAISQLPRRAVAFLSPEASPPDGGDGIDAAGVTFWQQFQASSRSLPPDDRRAMAARGAGENAGSAPEGGALRHALARVVAAELEHWFRREIIGPQRLLIDAPHLQARLGFRTDDEAHSPAAWTRTASEIAPPFGLEAATTTFVGAATYESPWLERPAFWRPIVEAHPDYENLTEAATDRAELVFCEDTRDFRARSADARPRRFVTELGRGVDVRYVAKLPGYQYAPASLFAR